MRNAIMRVLGVAALVGSTGCLPTYEPGAPGAKADPNVETGPPKDKLGSGEPVAVRPVNPDEQSSIYLDSGDPALIAARAADEGGLDVSSRRHSCMKFKFETLGRMLQNKGVNMGTLPVTIATNCAAMGVAPLGTLTQSARYVYCDSRISLGYPQYAGRLSESTSLTTASATKQSDLFVTAAQELVNSTNTLGMMTADSCKVNGVAAQLFNADNTCNETGITCIQGYQATADQLALCSRLVTQAEITPAKLTKAAIDAITTGKQLAVAAVLTAAQACE